MKKILTLLTACAMTAGMASLASADNMRDPEYFKDYFEYTPHAYFRSTGDENVHILKSGAAYVNTDALTDEGARINTYLYYYDQKKRTVAYFFFMAYDSNEIDLAAIEPTYEEYGSTFKKQEYQNLLVHEPDDDFLYKSVSCTLPTLGLTAEDVVSENTDDYPLCRIVSVVNKNSRAGRYEFYTHKRTVRNSLIMIAYKEMYGNTDSYDPETISEKQVVMLADRDLGDVDANGKVDEKDAELIMEYYTTSSNNKALPKANNPNFTIPCDVNGDGIVDDEDVTLILDYSLEGGDMTFYEYLDSIWG